MSDGAIFLYVSQSGSGRIAVLRLDGASGTLTPVQDIAAGGAAMPMAISPDRRFLYAGLRDDPDWRIASFAIDRADGTLTALGTVPAYNSTVYLATDRGGRFLLAANNPHHGQRTGTLCVAAIGEAGWVQEPYEIVRTPPKLHAVLPDPANRFLLATACDGDAILRYAFDAATGRVSADGLAPAIVDRGRGPRHLRFHPNGRFLYVVNEYDGSVCVFRYDAATGELFETQLVSALPPGYVPGDRRGRGISAAAADIHLTPNGRWLYASVRGSLTMAAFAVDPATGRLDPAGHAAMPREPRGFAIEPFGRFLFAAADEANVLAAYAIGADGGLRHLADHPLGAGPNWVECIRLP